MVLQTPGKDGWFWYIPLHDNIVSRRRRRAVRLPVQGPQGQSRADLSGRSRAHAGGEGAHREREARHRLLRDARLFVSLDRRCAGDGWVLVGDAFGFLDPLYSSGVLLALEVRRAGRRRDRRRPEEGRHQRRAARRVGRRTSTRASTACAGWCASTTTASASASSCKQLSRAAQHRHRSADRRPVHRPRRQGLGADGVALPRRQAAPDDLERRRRARTRRSTRPTSSCCPKGAVPKGDSLCPLRLIDAASSLPRPMPPAWSTSRCFSATWKRPSTPSGEPPACDISPARVRDHSWPRISANFDFKAPLKFEEEFEVQTEIAVGRPAARFSGRTS